MATLEHQNSRVALLGFGGEGQSSYAYFNKLGARISIFDENDSPAASDLSTDVAVTIAPASEWQLDDYDLVIRSPGISPHKFHTKAKVSSATSEFFDKCPAPIIGVTGTKGKGTTATLIAKILEEAGRKVHLLGNIGKPALDKLHTVASTDLVVYELSSFQLWDMNKSPHIAVVLMIQPEHLDVHDNLDDYLKAKSNITLHQTDEDTVIYHPTNSHSRKIAEHSPGYRYRYLTDEAANILNDKLVIKGLDIMDVSDFGLIGPHNRENICAALSASWEIVQDKDAAKRAISKFSGLEHRLELAGEVDGVKYYNDSFATIPEASIAAMKSFTSPTVIILGGSDKHSDYSELASYIKSANHIKKVVLIGEMGKTIKEALVQVGFDNYTEVDGDMKSIARKCREIATNGDVVLLSPACASFDMFESYKQRGELFKKAVREL